MNVGLDLGYSDVKGVSRDRRFRFPSATGSPNVARFSLNGDDDILINYEGQSYLVGEGAVSQSRFTNRDEDRNWTESLEYKLCIHAAFTELSTASLASLNIVTGLPVAFFERDSGQLKSKIIGEHKVTRKGRNAQIFRVTDCRVVMQGIGILLSLALDNQGKVTDKSLISGNVGVIDVGGKTTNLVSVSRLHEVPTETTSINIGAWDAVRELRDHLNSNYPGLEKLKDHQVIEVLKNRQIKYYDEIINLSPVVDRILHQMAGPILKTAGQLWNSGATLEAIVSGGGGAILLKNHIQERFHHAQIVDNAVYANALGYWKYAQYLFSKSNG